MQLSNYADVALERFTSALIMYMYVEKSKHPNVNTVACKHKLVSAITILFSASN